MQEIAQKQEGECLSTEYKAGKKTMEFRCKETHKWRATAKSIRSGNWCPLCGKRTIIQQEASALVSNFHRQAIALKGLHHKGIKGTLRELIISNFIKPFLTSQFSVGKGIIINKNNNQSNETDLIIYDNRILPPFFEEQKIGVYPAESVVATIEIKSELGKDEILKAGEAARELRGFVCNPEMSVFNNIGKYKSLNALPFCGVIGFYSKSGNTLCKKGFNDWLKPNATGLSEICLVGKCSWLNKTKGGWSLELADENYEETKRFIAVLIDNFRKYAEEKFRIISTLEADQPWLSYYIRR